MINFSGSNRIQKSKYKEQVQYRVRFVLPCYRLKGLGYGERRVWMVMMSPGIRASPLGTVLVHPLERG